MMNKGNLIVQIVLMECKKCTEKAIMVNTDKMTAEIIEELTFSEEDLTLLAKARKTPISFDEDCPETTPRRALKFRRVNAPRNSG